MKLRQAKKVIAQAFARKVSNRSGTTLEAIVRVLNKQARYCPESSLYHCCRKKAIRRFERECMPIMDDGGLA